jgi:uncharacterized membrane protein
MDIAQLLGIALHTLGFVIVCGYYGILARVVLPAIQRSLDPPAQATTLEAVERAALPLLLISAVLFLVTGTYLLLIDPEYQGLGAIRDSWSTLMLLKHLVVAGLVALGVTVDVLVRLVGEAEDDVTRTAAIRRVRLAAEGATGAAGLTILLTAAAQLSA